MSQAQPCSEPGVVKVTTAGRSPHVMCAAHAMVAMKFAEVVKQMGVVMEFEMITPELEAR